ncbi:LysM peptidoglycan-binding domain-containing protein [Maribacter antarcticus]|uniref:LysM peptidoglycan-binding domain-containing protein n=1 Tax=Maribacter antarcticus TaxID=505250 RepID=UPI00047B2177|nr:LysM peptidoglycan-binding domain-containing protein [Maribacter antarcticus]
MKYSLKTLLVTVALCIVTSVNLLAQKFMTHAVKKGETLLSVAAKYGVSTQSILQYNKEIKDGSTLAINTILVVPQAKVKTPVTTSRVNDLISNVMQDSVIKREPIGYTKHKVRKRETLYGIAKRYEVTEEDIKKYNKQLYASQLKKKMEIRIPKYKKLVEKENTIDPDAYEKYTVVPKETRWSIAHKYGITIDSMLVLNPALSQSTNYLAEGYELLMPKIAGSTVDGQQTQLYTSYTVPPKMNFYRLEQDFGVKSDEIVRLNPEITERGGLKEGMIIRIPETELDAGEINTDNYIFYEVKPKQNEFRLTRKFGMSWADLIRLNPELKSGLKAGMILKLPKEQGGDFEVRNALILDNVNLLDSVNTAIRPKVMFMLPFRLDKLDLSDKESVTWTIENRNSLKYSLGLYSGALVALDSLAALGISVDVKTFDNQLSITKTKEILVKERLSEYNAIFGPLDELSLKEVAVQASNYNVPVVAPVKAKSDISLNNVFFSYTDDDLLRKHMIDYVKSNFTDENIIIIADDKSKLSQELLVHNFPDAKVLKVKEEEKNIGINREKLGGLFSETQENWVFVESDNFKLISSVVSILNAFHNSLLDVEESTEKLRLRMFTTNHNNAFEDDVISSTHLSNLNFTYPSVYREVSSNSFVARYHKKFGAEPDKYAVRGFDVTYDVLLKLAYNNNLMDVAKFIGTTEYNGNKFDYAKDASSGYFNQASYIMSYDDMRIKQLQ